MARNIYTTANGRSLNIDQMRLLNEKVIAVGNMGVNARGDQVNSNGDIIKTRNEIMKERRSNSTIVRYNAQASVEQESAAQIIETPVTPVTPPTQIEQSVQSAPSNLRGSLANAVGVDLTKAELAPKKTITRI